MSTELANEHIVINEDRTWDVPASLKKIAVLGDHNVKTVVFDCPRFWNGKDLATFVIKVVFMRSDKFDGETICENITVDDADENLIHFTWTLKREATGANGILSVKICASITDENGDLEADWNSELCEELTVSKGIKCSDGDIEKEYPEMITYILQRLNAIDGIEVDDTLTVKGQAADAKITGDILRGYAEENKNNWKEQRFIAFGTSLTAQCAIYNGGYLEVICKRLGFSAYTNCGISGAGMTTSASEEGIGLHSCILNTDMSEDSLVLLECGTNDFKLNVPLGTVGIMGDTGFDTTTFCGAVRDSIEYILTNYPRMHILLIAAPQRYDGDYDVNFENTAGHKLIDYVDALIEIGTLYSLPVCDWYRYSGINKLTLDTYTTDGIHPNVLGYQALGNLTSKAIEEMYCSFGYEASTVWTDTALIINEVAYDISVSAGYEYKLIMNINDTLYLYYDTEPFKVYEEGYRECFTPDCYRSTNTNGVFGDVATVTNGTHQVDLGDGYWKMNKDRTLDQYVVSNHDIYYWGTDEIAVPATI